MYKQSTNFPNFCELISQHIIFKGSNNLGVLLLEAQISFYACYCVLCCARFCIWYKTSRKSKIDQFYNSCHFSFSLGWSYLSLGCAVAAQGSTRRSRRPVPSTRISTCTKPALTKNPWQRVQGRPYPATIVSMSMMRYPSCEHWY